MFHAGLSTGVLESSSSERHCIVACMQIHTYITLPMHILRVTRAAVEPAVHAHAIIRLQQISSQSMTQHTASYNTGA
jgi:hypothetical protein